MKRLWTHTVKSLRIGETHILMRTPAALAMSVRGIGRIIGAGVFFVSAVAVVEGAVTRSSFALAGVGAAFVDAA